MPSQDPLFTSFKALIADYNLPEKFTFPFYYQPHPLSLLAAKELQQQLELSNDLVGKMYGVLLVSDNNNKIGYLAAYSGKSAKADTHLKFVPSVFELSTSDVYFIDGQAEVNQINEQIAHLIGNPEIVALEQKLTKSKDQEQQQLDEQRADMVVTRKIRKTKRACAEVKLSLSELAQLKQELAQQSVDEKNQLRDLKLYWQEQVKNVSQKLSALTNEIADLKKARKSLSARLQKWLFQQYNFLNINKNSKNLTDLFRNLPLPIPPAGSGDCAAPKLLQYAFKQGLKPLALAEFWWGAAPKSEIRQHLNFYPACQGKCQPILTHMLEGMNVDENPLLVNPAVGKTLDIIFQDEAMVIINKPAEFLSVPGKNIEDSVYSRMKAQFPQASGPLIVHRLDMATSGLMVIALTKRAHKNLQKQFINRTVAKRYVALLDGEVESEGTEANGTINLPLRGDITDRPRQLVCFEHGKIAETYWQKISVIEKENKKRTKLYLSPKTGRTHQLRVHCAHTQGLNTPILGDDLYGNKSTRLHLHAEQLSLNHPLTKELMCFQVDADF